MNPNASVVQYQKLKVAFLTLSVSMLALFGGLNFLIIIAVAKVDLVMFHIVGVKERPPFVQILFDYARADITHYLMGLIPSGVIVLTILKIERPWSWIVSIITIFFLILHSAVFPFVLWPHFQEIVNGPMSAS